MLAGENLEFRTTVFIFYHADVLARLRDGDLHEHGELAQESIHTLGLLIPPDDVHCQGWFNGIYHRSEQHGAYGIPGMAAEQSLVSRRVSDYHHWRARLIILEKEFNDSSPGTLSAWWHDRRKRREWATFWISFCDAIFALLALVRHPMKGGSFLAGLVEATGSARYLSEERTSEPVMQSPRARL
ncbi:hypothetical protein EDB81DRAFT_890187 [Dactylonectria macrodidyma]|uniref:Uncharacterized protein n=1 Tax=Dactylonectria macrodidyma TaxID=307937 RepID=A0A9P9ILF6_9HYPO|nr:hypothetical protein EDB81DRAFT_890187 [Dactylonectria macrodidyma]